MPDLRFIPQRILQEYEPKPGSVEISKSWYDKIRKTNRLPFKTVDIERQALNIHAILESYLERPVGLLIDIVQEYPWFIEKPSWLRTIVKYRKRKGCLPCNDSPYSLMLHPEFLRYSEEQFIDFVDFILFPDRKSEAKFLTTCNGFNYPKKTNKNISWEDPLIPSGDYHQDIVSIGRNLELKYMPHIRAEYRWAQNVSLSVLGMFRMINIDSLEYYVIINPAFNDSSIPIYVLEHLIFHELLHAYFRLYEHRDRASAYWNGEKYNRSRPHCKVFKEAEASSPHYEAFEKWTKGNWREFALRRKKEWQKEKRFILKMETLRNLLE